MDRLVRPENADFLLSDLAGDEVIRFWSEHSAFHQLKEWLMREYT
ncbi:hypothetical protein [Alicyclobacillus fodiniaquatilis]|uniref:Uncharacterized protein n=1 Tax=Alicyclobacillus fodiniaquatilis TaxID=1661150 RepID=A0ABW4JL95_9BACL